ncbi:MAG TPA: peptidoglycan DD-metalloendopeptidase family protein [Bacillales bacterium]|nr:peptidoglycan DD-metalloendopeptidase family protein [Bacillales bacterium]
MNDFIKRVAVVFLLFVGISLLILGGKKIDAAGTDEWQWPIDGVITSTFGERGGTHYGIDLAAPKGTPVHAAKAGVVKKSYRSASYGNVVFLLHNNGYETVYAHLEKRYVNKGEHVQQGEVIGRVGSTGHSTGPHLHFEVHNGLWNVHKTKAVDPLLVLGNDQPPASSVHASGIDKSSPDETAGAKIVYTIKKGDTLWALSRMYDVSVNELKRWNGLSSDLIIAGDTLVIHKAPLQTYSGYKLQRLSGAFPHPQT